MERKVFVLPINPQPWEVGPLSVGRKGNKVYPIMGKAVELAAYQDAVRDEMHNRYPEAEMAPLGIYLRVNFYFSRNLGQYLTGTGRKAKDHIADTTNLQKATEDALQGILYKNDNLNTSVFSQVIGQSSSACPLVIIEILEDDRNALPSDILMMYIGEQTAFLSEESDPAPASDLSWPPKG